MYVYRFMNNNNQVVYVGKTKDIDRRMTQHSNSGHLTYKQYSEVERVEYISVDSEADMNLLEIYFINKYKPSYNQVSKTDDKLAVTISEDDLEWVQYDGHINNSPNKHKSAVLMFVTFNKEVMKKLNANEIALMTILSIYLDHHTNQVIFNGRSPSNKDLCNVIGLGLTTLKKTLSSLRKKGLVVTVGRGMGRSIYVNPLFASKTRDMDDYVVKLFEL